MVSRPTALLLIASFVASLFSAPLAWADHVKEGVLRCVAYYPMPADQAVRVTLFDDTTENIEIKRQIEDELRRAGISIDENSTLELAIDTEIIERGSPDGGPTLGSVEGSSEEGYDLRLNLWSSSRDSVFGGRKSDSTKSETKFHLNAVLRDHGTGRFLWQGDAYAVLHQIDNARVARSMVAPLVAGLGQAVASKSFPIH
jgi:hypothetical protein